MAGSLEGVLAGIPGLGGYLASRQQREQGQMQELQQVSALSQLAAQMQARERTAQEDQRKQAWRDQVAALGPNATHEQLAQLAYKSGLMDPNQVATLAQGAENKKLQTEATKQTALARLVQQADLSRRTHEYRMSTLNNAQDRLAEQSRHNLENEEINRESVRLTGQRLNLSTANAAFNQANAAANTGYNTGAVVTPTVSAAPAPAIPSGGRLMAGGMPIPQEDMAAAEAVMGATAAGIPMTRVGGYNGGALAQIAAENEPHAPPPAPRNNLDARDLALRNMGGAAAASSAAVTPTVATPTMPPVIAAAPKKVQDQWRLSQGKSDIKADINLAGGRESTFINRVVMAGNQAAADLENVVKLPIDASRGIFGGRQQGKSLFEAGKETLTNTMTTQDVQTYNVLATGFQRALAAIEGSGLAPTNTLIHQMDAVIFKEGDTNWTKLMKLAQTRQIVEKGLETTLANPRVPDETKKHIEQIVGRIRRSVPFTASDLFALQQAQGIDPNATLASVLKAKESGASGGWSIRPR